MLNPRNTGFKSTLFIFQVVVEKTKYELQYYEIDIIIYIYMQNLYKYMHISPGIQVYLYVHIYVYIYVARYKKERKTRFRKYFKEGEKFNLE